MNRSYYDRVITRALMIPLPGSQRRRAYRSRSYGKLLRDGRAGDHVQTAIDSSPFSSTGTFPITVEATTDENGDWGLSFGSVDGTVSSRWDELLTDVLAPASPTSSAADVDIANFDQRDRH